jgi:hypothetical protein
MVRRLYIHAVYTELPTIRSACTSRYYVSVLLEIVREMVKIFSQKCLCPLQIRTGHLCNIRQKRYYVRFIVLTAARMKITDCPGMLLLAVWLKFADVSEVLTASCISAP